MKTASMAWVVVCLAAAGCGPSPSATDANTLCSTACTTATTASLAACEATYVACDSAGADAATCRYAAIDAFEDACDADPGTVGTACEDACPTATEDDLASCRGAYEACTDSDGTTEEEATCQDAVVEAFADACEDPGSGSTHPCETACPTLSVEELQQCKTTYASCVGAGSSSLVEACRDATLSAYELVCDDTDRHDDTDPRDDTADTANVGQNFNPTTISFASDVAFGLGGGLIDYTTDGTTVPSNFTVEMTDGRDTCTLIMSIHDSAAIFVGAAFVSSDNQSLHSWLINTGNKFGFRVEEGSFDRFTDGPCDELDPANFGTDPFEWILDGPLRDHFMVGIRPTYNAAIQAEIDVLLQGSSITLSKVYGGTLRFGFEFTNGSGDMVDYFDIMGIAARMDLQGNVIATPQGDLDLLDADQIWDQPFYEDEPGPAFYRLISPFVLNYTW